MSIYSPSNSGGVVSPSNSGGYSLASSDISRTLPRQLSSGSTRGTQTVGYGDTKIDGSNNTITLGQGITLDGTNESITVENVGTPVITMGKNTDNTFNFRVLDANGIGLAQFGQFPDKSIALKVAMAGIEVSTATPQQLVFSSTASFTVALQSTISFPSLGPVTTGSIAQGPTTVIPHGLKFTPFAICLMPAASSNVFTTFPTGFPQTAASPFMSGAVFQQTPTLDAFTSVFYAVDNTNFYIGQVFSNSSGGTVTQIPPVVQYVVFTLQTNT